MIDWFLQNNISFTSTKLKLELHNLIKPHKARAKLFKIDSVLVEKEHSV